MSLSYTFGMLRFLFIIKSYNNLLSLKSHCLFYLEEMEKGERITRGGGEKTGREKFPINKFTSQIPITAKAGPEAGNSILVFSLGCRVPTA